VSRRPTYAQIAADFGLWQEYADPNATMDQPAFDETPMDERLGLLKQAFGPELPALEPGFYGVTELHRAVWDGDAAAVRQLLSKGANVDEADLDGDTALLAAARHGDERIMDILLEAGADPYLANHEGESPSQYLVVQNRVVDPVHRAVAAADTATLASLIADGADLRHLNSAGETPAHVALSNAYRYDLGLDRYAVDTRHRLALDMLLQADPGLAELPDSRHLTLSDHVAGMDLGACPSPPLASADPQAAMWAALATGDGAELSDVLNRCPVDVNQRTSDGATPLHVAAKNGRAAQVKSLLAYLADTNAAWCGMTPLYVATSAGHPQTMQLLLKAGSDPLAAPVGGCALHVAAERRDPAALALLLETMPATVNPVDESTGQTPLHVAAKRGNAEHCRLLVAHGASLTQSDHLGRNALDHAKGNTAVLDAFTLGGADLTNAQAAHDAWQTDAEAKTNQGLVPAHTIAQAVRPATLELEALQARVAELEADNSRLLHERQQLKASLERVLGNGESAPVANTKRRPPRP